MLEDKSLPLSSRTQNAGQSRSLSFATFIWSQPVFVRVQHVDAWMFSPDCYRLSILSQSRKANVGAKIDWKGLRGVGFLNVSIS